MASVGTFSAHGCWSRRDDCNENMAFQNLKLMFLGTVHFGR